MKVVAAPVRSECDLLVVGSGAGGLAAAVTAAALGLKVSVLEKEPVFGGTTAWSGGWMWVPRNPLAMAAGIVEPAERPRIYLRHELGAQFDAARVDAFLAHAPRMVAFFQQLGALAFIDGNAVPDFHGASPGAALGGRSVCAAPFDARALGARVADLKSPLDLISPWGMGIASGAELRHFLNAMRVWSSFRVVARQVVRHFRDLLLHGRGMRLVGGNALVARLAKSAFDLGVEIRVASPVSGLLREGGRVVGASVTAPDGSIAHWHARRGVVLASGGFPHDTARKQALFAHAPSGTEHWSAAPPGNTGDGLRLGESAGGSIDPRTAHPGAWAPVSLVPRRDGSVGHFPHLMERAKPGLIAVTRAGRRFVDEAGSYHDFMKALFEAVRRGEPVQAWLVCDHRFIRRYGLGHVRPAPFPLAPALHSGYLQRADTAAGLARRCGIEVAGFVTTLDAYNRDARHGRDPAFGRGSTPYDRVQGDTAQRPNPNVAPIETGPFYAVKVVPGSLGTFAGLRTDASARVLDAGDVPIAGLYACGNDAASVMGGHYPSGGITLGPAMTFGYIAAHHAAGITPGA